MAPTAKGAKANAKKVANPKAKQEAAAKRILDQSHRVRHSPDRHEEHQIRWTEDRLKTIEGSESAAFKTWDMVKRGKTEVIEDKRTEFMKAYRETGSFEFVTTDIPWSRKWVRTAASTQRRSSSRRRLATSSPQPT